MGPNCDCRRSAQGSRPERTGSRPGPFVPPAPFAGGSAAGHRRCRATWRLLAALERWGSSGHAIDNETALRRKLNQVAAQRRHPLDEHVACAQRATRLPHL
eukprot:4359674-Prymnesium_polylepis.1